MEKPRRARFSGRRKKSISIWKRPARKAGKCSAQKSRCPAAVRPGKKECSQVAKESRAMFLEMMGCPSRVTDPNPYRSRPRMHLSRVVLPAPLGPKIPTISPGPTDRLTSSRAC
ncbi:Uncharacterised protein [Flavonifractor plautii]|uniref:Uncharacterized protein n=1 Tax=Flavonifractor plautii TaxID=292800 RepID=A0A174VFA6_FLAPL|nr:Uncharacterised protein [Flavonifractor plautii]